MEQVKLCDSPCAGTNGVTCEECQKATIERERSRIISQGMIRVPLYMERSWRWFVSKYELNRVGKDYRDVVECFLESMG